MTDTGSLMPSKIFGGANTAVWN